jgi:uncharacterized protein YqeY
MDLRNRIAAALEAACTEGDVARSSTLRLIEMALRDREQAQRGGDDEGLGTAEVHDMLSRLARQRRDSAAAFERDGRLEQAADKTREAEIIEEFLPRRLSEEEIEALIDATVERLKARSLRDIGRVMGALRPELVDQLDPVALKAQVRSRLENPG